MTLKYIILAEAFPPISPFSPAPFLLSSATLPALLSSPTPLRPLGPPASFCHLTLLCPRFSPTLAPYLTLHSFPFSQAGVSLETAQQLLSRIHTSVGTLLHRAQRHL